MSTEKAQQTSIQQSSTALNGRGVLQRACACGNHTIAGGAFGSCENTSINIQRAAINRDPLNDVLSIVHEVLSSPGQSLDAATRAFFEPRFGHDLSPIHMHRRVAGGLQTKLTVSQPGDPYEEEADRVAEKVMQIGGLSGPRGTANREPGRSRQIQRASGEWQDIRQSPNSDAGEQRDHVRPASQSSGEMASSTRLDVESVGDAGEPLPAGLRYFATRCARLEVWGRDRHPLQAFSTRMRRTKLIVIAPGVIWLTLTLASLPKEI